MIDDMKEYLDEVNVLAEELSENGEYDLLDRLEQTVVYVCMCLGHEIEIIKEDYDSG
jgi:hypothetical protein